MESSINRRGHQFNKSIMMLIKSSDSKNKLLANFSPHNDYVINIGQKLIYLYLVSKEMQSK